ncbi:MAG: hypothetical protein DBX47_04175 [Clostridiales bacterium]|nr:MAG: hypothetical protein DBX47_04175 [Clostridiales bacterium]
MIEWWNALSLASQIFTAIAVPATLIMIVQALLLLFGIGIDHDVNGDGTPDSDGHDGFSLISVRGIVAFFSIGGWVGLLCDGNGMPIIFSVLLSFASGLLALISIALLFKYSMKLSSNGTMRLEEAVGKTGKVYIPIPPRGMGLGKINILLQDSLVEIEAINETSELIGTGEIVMVVSLADAGTVTVKKIYNNGGISQWIQ